MMCISALPALAFQFQLPQTARQTAARDSTLDQVALPIAPFGETGLTTAPVEGPVTRRAYRIATAGQTPLQILAPLRAQLEEAGYDIILDCDQDSCGGFDFRFAIDVLPAPNMYVNIRAYHFVTARAGAGSAVTLLASAASGAGYLQIISVGDAPENIAPISNTPTAPNPNTTDDAPNQPLPDGEFVQRLVGSGAAVLSSIDFAVGTITLSDTPSPELSELANLLETRPGLRVAVVGHTDTVGGLEANINVSRARAAAVRTRLIEEYNVDPDQVEAAGMGYLAPRASNLTEDGRQTNRRVEVIVVREDDG